MHAFIKKTFVFPVFLNKQYTVVIGGSFMTCTVGSSCYEISNILPWFLAVQTWQFPHITSVSFYSILKQFNVFTLLMGGIISWGVQYFKQLQYNVYSIIGCILWAYWFINWVIWFRHDFNQSTCDLSTFIYTFLDLVL